MAQFNQIARVVPGTAQGVSATQNLAAILRSSALMQAISAASAFRMEPTQYQVDKLYINSSGASYRAIGASGDYTDQVDTPHQLTYEELKAMGFSRVYDRSYAADVTMGDTRVSLQWQRKISKLCADVGKSFEVDVCSADGSGNKYLGFKSLLAGNSIYSNYALGTGSTPGVTYVTRNHENEITYARWFDPTQAIGSSADSFDLSDQDNFLLFQEVLDTAISHVPGVNQILCNQQMAARITTMGRRAGNVVNFMNEFGQRITSYDGIPIVVSAAGAITNTEPNKNETPVNDTTSIYLVRWAEEDAVAIATNGAEYTEFDRLPTSPRKAEKFEFRHRPVIYNGNAILRIPLIKI